MSDLKEIDRTHWRSEGVGEVDGVFEYHYLYTEFFAIFNRIILRLNKTKNSV